MISVPCLRGSSKFYLGPPQPHSAKTSEASKSLEASQAPVKTSYIGYLSRSHTADMVIYWDDLSFGWLLQAALDS